MQKPLVFVGQNEDACFCAMIALEIDFGSIFDRFWVRFWNDFGVQTRSQKQLIFFIDFWIDFLTILARLGGPSCGHVGDIFGKNGATL